MSDNPTFQIPKDVIEPIIKAHVSAAVMTALGDKQKLLEDVISGVLNQRVESDSGKPTTNTYYAVTFIDWAMKNAVKSAFKEALQEQISFHKESLKKAIAKELGIEKKYSPLAKSLIEGMVGALSHPDLLKYRISVAYDDKK